MPVEEVGQQPDRTRGVAHLSHGPFQLPLKLRVAAVARVDRPEGPARLRHRVLQAIGDLGQAPQGWGQPGVGLAHEVLHAGHRAGRRPQRAVQVLPDLVERQPAQLAGDVLRREQDVAEPAAPARQHNVGSVHNKLRRGGVRHEIERQDHLPGQVARRLQLRPHAPAHEAPCNIQRIALGEGLFTQDALGLHLDPHPHPHVAVGGIQLQGDLGHGADLDAIKLDRRPAAQPTHRAFEVGDELLLGGVARRLGLGVVVVEWKLGAGLGWRRVSLPAWRIECDAARQQGLQARQLDMHALAADLYRDAGRVPEMRARTHEIVEGRADK